MTSVAEATAPPPTAVTPPASARGGRPYRLTVEQYCRMIEAGVLADAPRVELWEGQLVEKMGKNRPHAIAQAKLNRLLVRLVPDGWYVAVEEPIALGDDKVPEPDLAVVRGTPDDYPHRPPTGRDVALVVEVADTSLKKDLGTMFIAYAGQAIPIYWVVNLGARRIEVYSEPGAPASFRTTRSFGPDEDVPVVLDGREVGRIAVRDVLP
ncbi:MAG TPA: Uma2 family endonuclease [Isosphaeraceae bacterium]|jgi:Uma2 family endonuclease